MKKDSPIAPKKPRSAQKAEETEISSPEVEILDAPPSRKRPAPAGGGTRGAAAKARTRSTEGKAAKSILDVDGSAVREVPSDSVSDDQDDEDALADSADNFIIDRAKPAGRFICRKRG